MSATLRDEWRYIELSTARRIASLRAGAYTSRRPGEGFEFRDHRPYRAGDDIRRIDWNVTARLRAPFMRVTYAERELDLIVLLDLSRSIRAGSHASMNHRAMLRAAASLVFSAIADRINVGVATFGSRLTSFHPPRRSRSRAWAALDAVAALDPIDGHTDVNAAGRDLLARLRRTSLVCVISDFLDDAAGDWSGLRVLGAHHDLVAVVVSDGNQRSMLPGFGELRLRDVESGRVRSVKVTPGGAAAYAKAGVERLRALTHAIHALGGEVVVIDAGADPIEPLVRLFLARKAS